jgi:hypothetical protein
VDRIDIDESLAPPSDLSPLTTPFSQVNNIWTSSLPLIWSLYITFNLSVMTTSRVESNAMVSWMVMAA